MSNNTTALAVRDNQSIQSYQEESALSPQQLLQQVELIQTVMKSVMKDGEHYGVIPGCGQKKSLFKPGAEKLSLTFRLRPEYQETIVELANGHREYRVKCALYSIVTGRPIGEGLGSCTTMEGKYRFRPGPVEFTGKAVPRGYWDLRKSDPKKAQEMIGGKGFSTKKNDEGMWEIVQAGEIVEHSNPADYYNTCLKMAKKRAHVDAILTATGASDIFTQDVEDIQENLAAYKKPTPESEAPERPPEQPKSNVSYVEERMPVDVESEPVTQSDSPDWRDHKIHFGKQTGLKLGALKPESLKWWIDNFEPKPWPAGSDNFKQPDLDLRLALNQAQKELAAEAA